MGFRFRRTPHFAPGLATAGWLPIGFLAFAVILVALLSG
jgi:hypothetical protein